MENAKINGKDLYKDYGLVVGNNDVVGIPKPKKVIIEVPGASKVIDLSEALTGKMEYENRMLNFKLGGSRKVDNWQEFLSKFLMDVHGKNVKVVLDSDPSFYYEGRAEVTGFDRLRHLGFIELSIDCSPYKYSVHSSLDGWIWDSFCFDTDVVREYMDIDVLNSKKIEILGSDMTVVPVFYVDCKNETSEMRVLSKRLSKSFVLSRGKNRFAELEIAHEGDTLTFYGTFKVSIDFKGGRL